MSSLIPKFSVGRRLTLPMILATCMVLASCARTPIGPLSPGDQNDPWIVTIKFVGTSKCDIQSVVADTRNTCGLPASDICVEHSKFLQWESNPASVGFNIYFDPLQGGPTHTAPNGKKRVQIASPGKIPPVAFKYAILGRHNSCDPLTDTVDPRIRVDN